MYSTYTSVLEYKIQLTYFKLKYERMVNALHIFVKFANKFPICILTHPFFKPFDCIFPMTRRYSILLD